MHLLILLSLLSACYPWVSGKDFQASQEVCTWYADADGDGFGDILAESRSGCTDPGAGWSQTSDDCNDTDSTVYPDAQELCDGIANDCRVQELDWDEIDNDGDGWVECLLADAEWKGTQDVHSGGDCDDTAFGTNPGEAEIAGDGIDADCDGREICYTDADADGYRSSATVISEDEDCLDAGEALSSTPDEDCDDQVAVVHPGADEHCNGIDDDCDGEIDDSAIEAEAWFRDADGDGWGSSDESVVACESPVGFVDNDGDCDDVAPDTNPGEVETVADGIDADCDGQETCYADGDDDGYRTASTVSSSDEDCLDSGEALGFQPDGDCDDTDGSTSPGAVEVTADGVDNDCDGYEECYLDGDLDGHGSLDTVQSFNTDCSDEGESYDATDCEDANPARTSCFGGTIDMSAADAKLAGEAAGDDAGWSVSGAGDVNGDGRADLLVGAGSESSGGTRAGAAYVLLGPVVSGANLSMADAKLVGEAADDWAGFAVADAGDVDGDGNGDILVGAMQESSAGLNAGAAYLVLGPVSGTLDLSSADAKLFGEGEGHSAGSAVSSAGDVNGDGRADILVAARTSPGGLLNGAVYLLLGPVSGPVDLSSADAKLVGEDERDMAGQAVSGAGDVDGDGFDDLLIGADGDETVGAFSGAAYLLLSPVSGTHGLHSADAKLVGMVYGDQAGSSVSGAGDVDGDGHADFLVGAKRQDAASANAGAAYLVLDSVAGTVDLDLADAKLVGETSGDEAGFSVSGAGDVDGDGNSDILVGAPLEDSGGDGAGAAYLVLGPVSGVVDLGSADAKFVGEAAGDNLGGAVSGVGDVDGDGKADLLLGAYLEDFSGDRAGAAYLVLGGGL